LVWQVRREPRALDPGPRLLLAVGMVGCLALALAQVRWVTYVQVLSAPALAMLVVRVRDRWGTAERLPLMPTLARASTSAALVAGPILAAALLFAVGPGQAAAGAGPPGAAAACQPEAVAAFLADTSPFSEAPHTVAA